MTEWIDIPPVTLSVVVISRRNSVLVLANDRTVQFQGEVVGRWSGSEVATIEWNDPQNQPAYAGVLFSIDNIQWQGEQAAE